MEQLQHRNDTNLPPLPPKLIRDTPGSVLSPVAVQPVKVLGPKIEINKILIKPIIGNLREQAGLSKEFNADEAVNHEGLQAALAAWRRQQKG